MAIRTGTSRATQAARGIGLKSLAGVGLIGAALALADSAAAQTAAVVPTPSEPVGSATAPGVEGVVVTASRIARTGFTAPTPVTTVGAEQIENRAPTTVGEILQQVPSFRATSTPNTSGVNSLGGGQVTADLRGLGAPRTLVLVNGRRFVPTTASSTVDLKLIPTLLVNQVEVVTGGASAAWGSDAVAGVVNFILKDRIQGFQGTVQYGASERGDNKELKLSAATGGSFLDDKLRFTAGLDYLDNKGIGDQYTRAWGRKEYGLITNSAYATNGLPNYIISPGVHPSAATEGGVITTGPLKGLAFGPGGSTYQFQYGQVYGTSMIGGTEEGKNPSLSANLGSPLRSLNSLAHFDYTFTPSLSAFAETSLSWAWSGGASQQPRDAALVIQRDNAYLPASVRAQMTTLGLTSITIGRTNDDTGKEQLRTHDQTYRVVGGLRGSLFGSWKWDAYYQWGRNRYALRFGPNNRIQANFARAADAVVGPTGAIVCRSSLTAANGCIPENVFGNGSETVNAYSFGTALYNLITEEQVAALNLQGDLFTLPAGPVTLALGAEYRKESGAATSDLIAQQVQTNGSVGGYALGNQQPFAGSYDTKEVYGETDIPLLKDMPAFHSLDVNGAVRRTDYSTSGPVTTWKLGFNYEPVGDLRFRGTLSRDIRAPNLSELFMGGSASSFTNVFDPVKNAQVQVQQVPRGNTSLQPEVAKTKSIGFVYRPSWLSRLDLSVDYYNIDVQQVISTIGAPQLVNGCFAGVALYCTSIAFNPDKSIAYVISQQLNLNRLATDGVDFELGYTLPAGSLVHGAPGAVSFRGLATYVGKLVTTDPAGVHDYIGQMSNFNRVNGVPHWTGTADLAYRQDRFLIDLQARVIGSGLYSAILTQGAGAANTINDNHVPARVYLNLTGQLNFSVAGRRLELYGVVNNLLNKDPPFLPSGAAGGTNESSTNSVFYDVIGRVFKVGLRFRY